ncbi:hypothetical protein M5K25_007028 [Dendrobium thyrsiflorum]|uniref:Uncharacterized protein n=1 Tax=Dendrobium thyrsiflorum TaxID=117978 RepID=A0ABD0VD27_DENTH
MEETISLSPSLFLSVSLDRRRLDRRRASEGTGDVGLQWSKGVIGLLWSLGVLEIERREGSTMAEKRWLATGGRVMLRVREWEALVVREGSEEQRKLKVSFVELLTIGNMGSIETESGRVSRDFARLRRIRGTEQAFSGICGIWRIRELKYAT